MRGPLWIAGFFALALVPSVALALEVPPLRGHVNDYASLLPPERAAALERRLTEYERRTGQQFALLTIPSLEGDPIEDFSIRAAEQWKLGQKGEDNGLILIVVPNDRRMRIEVGYGLEGRIPDAIASRIIREVIAPEFRSGDMAGGIEAAFGALMHAGSSGQAGERPAPAAKPRSRAPRGQLAPLFLPLFFFVLFSLLGGGRRGRFRRGFFYVGPTFGGGFGGGGFGGGGGGGFRGGGGGFGGGGASGSW